MLDARRFPPPGRVLPVGDSRLHIHVLGRGLPAVVFEAGVAGTSIGWALVQPEVGRFTTAAAYDRAGLGWSGRSKDSKNVEQIVGELRRLLTVANLTPPYVLVGHSFGGLVVRAFAHVWPREVAGLVLVDPASVTTWANCSSENRARVRLGANLSRRGAILARLGVVRGALAAIFVTSKFSRMVARISAPTAESTLSRLAGEVQKLPREMWPVIRSHWSRAKCMTAMAEYLESLPEFAAAVASMPIPDEIPVAILSAGNATAAELREREGLIARSSGGRHDQLEGTGHWVQLERPDAVVQAVRQVLEQHEKRNAWASGQRDMGANDSLIHRGDTQETGDNEARPTQTGAGPAKATFDPTSLGGTTSIRQTKEGPPFDADEELREQYGFEIMEPTDARLGLTNLGDKQADDWAADTGDTRTAEGS